MSFHYWFIPVHGKVNPRKKERCTQSVTIVSLVLRDALNGTWAGTGFVSTSKYRFEYLCFMYISTQ